MFALGVFSSVVEMQLGIYLMQGSSIGLHTEQSLKRGVVSCKRANEKDRVVSMSHPRLFCIRAMQLWKFLGITLAGLG